MGLNLGNLGKKITDVLGGVERQINPFDNGKTYNNKVGNRPAPAPVVNRVNQATGFNGTPFQAPAPFNPRAIEVPKVNMLTEVPKQFGLGVFHDVVDPVVHSANNLTNIGIGANAMGVDALAHATGNKQLSKALQPYIKGTIGSVDWVQKAADKKHQGETTVPTILGGAGADAINTYGVLPVGKGVKVVGKVGSEIVDNAPKLVTKLAKGADKTAPMTVKQATKALAADTKPSVTLKTPSVAQSSVPPTTPGTLGETFSDAGKATAERYAKVGNKVKAKEAFNPYQAGAKIDANYAKQLGISQNAIPKTESLEALAERSRNSRPAADQAIRDSDLGNIIRKYGHDNPASKEFNVYRVALRDLEQRSLGGKSILPENTDVLAKQVAEYEGRNPSARTEVQMINGHINSLQDAAVQAGHLDAESVAAARAKSPNFYTPIQRAVPEEVERASMNSHGVGSIGKQSLLQEFTGSDVPIDTSFNSLTDYVHNATREINKAKLAQKYAERVKQGVAPGRFTDTVENVLNRNELNKQIKAITETTNVLKTARNKTATKVSLARKDVALAGKNVSTASGRYGKVATDIRKVLRSLTPEGDGFAAISGLKDKDLVDIFNTLVENDTKGIEGLRQRLVKTTKAVSNTSAKLDQRAAHAEQLTGQLQDLRSTIQGLKGARAEVKANSAEYRADPTTGLQVVSGRDKGVTYRIETTPEVARFLQGLGQEDLNGIIKATKAAQTPFRTVFTGALNPVFAVTSTAWNALMAPVLSQEGLKVYGPKAVAESFKSFNKHSEFQKLLRINGAQKFTGNLSTSENITTAEAVASERSLADRIAFFIKHPGKGVEKLDVIQSKLENAQRTGIAKASYEARLAKGGTPEQAIADAVYSFNNVLPNFGRASSLVKQIDGVLMYSNATVASQRALLTAIKRDPIGTGAKLGAVTAGMAAITAHSLAQTKGQEFYDDMVASKRGSVLDNNIIVVLPGAEKNTTTGEWTGIIKLSIPPELRPVQHAVRTQMIASSHEQSVPLTQYAASMFDFVTGQARTLNNPALQVAASVGLNKNLQTGGDAILPEVLAHDTQDQKTKKTSDTAIKLGAALGVSPAKIDLVLGTLGFPGAVARGVNKDTSIMDSAAKYATGRVSGATGQSDGSKYFATVKEATKGLNKDELAAYNTLHPPKKDATGAVVYEADSVYNPAARLDVYNRFPKVFEVDKQLDAKNRAKGEPGNPLYDLNALEVKKVLEKDNLPPGAKDPELSNLYDKPWYQDYQIKKSSYFTAVKDKLASDLKAAQDSGNTDKAKSLQTGLDKFNSSDNPYPVTEKALQSVMDSYSALPKGTGERSAWIKAHPDEWTMMQNQFAKIDDWQNIQRGKRGLMATEGQLGKDNGFGTSSSSGGYGQSTPSQNMHRLDVSINAGGKVSAPHISIKSGKVAAKGKTVALNKPKVSSKRSMV
jgi:hypothetical protein